jgi:hypothetical protein
MKNILKKLLLIIFKILDFNIFYSIILNENKYILIFKKYFLIYYVKLLDIDKIKKIDKIKLSQFNNINYINTYYNKVKSLHDLKRTKLPKSKLSYWKAFIVYEKIVNFVNKNNLNSKNTYIIQVGSCSGRELFFFNSLFPNINYVSTDIDNNILNFQKEKYSDFKNFLYVKCFAHQIDICLHKYNLFNKRVILFTCSSLQYVHPLLLKIFFKKIKLFTKIDLFILEPVSRTFINSNETSLSKLRGVDASISHKYSFFSKEMTLIEKKLIYPYNISRKRNPSNYDAAHYYLHCTI